jgi:hypothetical protein
MTFDQCIRVALTYIGDAELKKFYDDHGLNDGLDVENNRKIDALVECCDVIINQIACEFCALTSVETVNSSSRKILPSSLNEDAVEILSVKRDGKAVPFRISGNAIVVPEDGAYQVKYAYAPARITRDNTAIPFFGSGVTARVVGIGMAAEYMMINGFNDEALALDDLFSRAIRKIQDAPKNARMPQRSWK